METRLNTLPLALLAGALAWIPGPSRAESFGGWFNRQIERGRWEALKLATPPEPGETEKVAKPTAKIFDLYRARLPPDAKIERWEAVKLPRALQMPAAEPTPGYYNTHILWALQGGKRVAGFRPVNTSTGCLSGCSPLVFHLALSPEGKVTGLIEETERPLRKLGHAPFTAADRQKALEIAQKLPEGLRDVDGPADLTDDTPYPAQTWTVLRPMLVPGAAYTSYRIYEAALKSLESIHPDDNAAAAEQERALVAAALQTEPPKAFEAMQKLLTPLADANTPPDARRAALRLLPALLLWQIEDPAPGADALKSAQAVFARPEYRASRLRAYCRFKTLLADSPSGLAVLAKIVREPKAWPFCSAESDAALAYLAGQAKKEASAPPIPNFAWQSPTLLMAYAEAAQKAGHAAQARQAQAGLRVRFPDFAPAQTLKINEADLEAAELAYRDELRRELVPATTPFPRLEIGRGKKLALDGKRVFFVFAAWCPHCQHTLAELGRRRLPEKSWARWQLIEAFPRPGSGADGAKLCRESKLPAALCRGLVRAVDSPANKDFFRELSLFTIPRVLVTDENGRVTAFDFKFDFREGRDALRDLNWLIEEIDQ